MRLIHLNSGLNHRLQVTIQHSIQVVRLVAGTVIRNAVLREVVSTDTLRTVHGTHLRSTVCRVLSVNLLLLVSQQARTQNAHRSFTVLQLRLLILHRHHNTGRKVSNTHRRVSGIHRLTAGARRTVHVNLQVVLVNLDFLGLIHLGEHQNTSSRSVDTALRLSRRNTLHTVHATLILQVRPHALSRLIRGALNSNLGILVTANIGAGRRNNLSLPALVFGITHVHAQQVTSEQSRLVTTGTSLHLKNDVTAIIRVTRNQQAAQLLLSNLQLLLQTGNLRREIRILISHLASSLKVILQRSVLVVRSHNTGQLRVTAAHTACLTLVRLHSGVSKLILQVSVLIQQNLNRFKHSVLSSISRTLRRTGRH